MILDLIKERIISFFFRQPALTVDAVVSVDKKGIVLVKRGRKPYRGWLALPGGYVHYGETVEEACVREVYEETGYKIGHLRLIGVYSSPKRDPNKHVITIVFSSEVIGGKIRPSKETPQVLVCKNPVNKRLAFDHNDIVQTFFINKNIKTRQ